MSPNSLAALAAETGELGLDFLAPPSAGTIEDLVTAGGPAQPVGPGQPGDQTQTTVDNSGTLTNVTEGVAPTPTGTTLDLGSTDQTQDQATQQTQDTNRDPVQESQGQETVSAIAEAVIRIVIQRPGGTP